MNIINHTAKIAALCLLPGYFAPEMAAQSIMDGSVILRDVAVSRADDRLLVSMDIDTEGLKVSSNREVTLTPMLTLGIDTLKMHTVTIAGRNRYFVNLRNGTIADGAELYRSGEQPVIRYSEKVEYDDWMKNATLAVANETSGCCSEEMDHGYDPLLAINFEPPVFRPEFVYVRPVAVPKINVLEGSAYIDFPVSRTEIYPDYRRNPAELQKILATIDAVKNDADTRIIALSIKGYASPESPYSNNERLAKGRTASLKDYVQRQYSFPESIITTSYEPEDWAGLERYVEQSSLENRDAILGIIRGSLEPDAKEAKIKKTFPADYAFLLKNVYPGLRHSDYAVKYEVRAYTDVDEIKRMLKTQPSKLSLNEMYLAAQTMEPGSPEFDETFDIAVRMFPHDSVANLNAANVAMQIGDMKRARRYLDNAGTSPQAVYARGVLAAMSGDYDAAMPLLENAGTEGVKEAAAMIEQIKEIQSYTPVAKINNSTK